MNKLINIYGLSNHSKAMTGIEKNLYLIDNKGFLLIKENHFWVVQIVF